MGMRPLTADLKIEVVTRRLSATTSRGNPTLTESTFTKRSWPGLRAAVQADSGRRRKLAEDRSGRQSDRDAGRDDPAPRCGDCLSFVCAYCAGFARPT